MVGRVTGEVEVEHGVLVIRRIHVRFELRATPEQRETAERVLAVFADSCPLYRSLNPAFPITTEVAFL